MGHASGRSAPGTSSGSSGGSSCRPPTPVGGPPRRSATCHGPGAHLKGMREDTWHCIRNRPRPRSPPCSWPGARFGQASVRPFWAVLCASIPGRPLRTLPGRPLCAHSGHASARPSLGRSMCAHSGQASVRPVWAASVRSLWASLDAPILGKSPCTQFGYAFGRPFWEAPARPFGTGFLCARSMGRPLCSHSGQASVRPFRQT